MPQPESVHAMFVQPTAKSSSLAESVVGDLASCDREPIHIPGSIQPHGVLLTLSSDGQRVLQSSENISEHFGIAHQDVLGMLVLDLVDDESAKRLAAGLASAELDHQPLYLCTAKALHTGEPLHAVAHCYRGVLFLEFEPAASNGEVTFQNLYPLVRSFLGGIGSANSVEQLAAAAAAEVRRITGFSRVLVYRFDASWSGNVIGESREEFMPSYQGLWFPASDIPKQARTLYEVNRVRLIADAAATPVPVLPVLHPETGQLLDMSFAGLRSVSPIHLEYVRNMGVLSSMSISIVRKDGRLWGLIACHHHQARTLPFDVRTACDLLGQSLSVQIQATEQRLEYESRIRLQLSTTQLLSLMAQEENFLNGLKRHPDELLSFVGAGGAAILANGECERIGDCPAEDDLWRLANWLVSAGRPDVYATDHLAREFAESERYQDIASGLLAMSISRVHPSFVMWFRPEVIQTVNWGGDPRKAAEQRSSEGRIHPRRSFEAWSETVRQRSLPWQPVELDAAANLRRALLEILLRKAEEMAQMSAELQRSNRELEAFSYSVSHDLRAPFRHIIGYSELLKQSPTLKLSERDGRYLDVITKSAHFAGTLVDNLLHFSQVGRAKLKLQTMEMDRLVEEVIRDLDSEVGEREVDWQIGTLPNVEGDRFMLRLVWQNLLQNALKYTRTRSKALIVITAVQNEGETVFSVRDNGIGFDQAYADKLFGVFQRLHRMEDYEGTGVGLANVRRIVAKHGGTTWAEGKVNEGAQFFFSLPLRILEHA